MDSYCLRSLESNLRKERHPDVKRTVHNVPRNETRDEFMSRHLEELESNGTGIFTAMKKRGPDQIQWRCERGNKCKGKSSGDPMTTRANSCGAYVSFTFVSKNTFNNCIVRLMNKHSGHDLSNPQEDRSNQVDSDLIAYIHTCFQLGDSNAEILLKCKEWAKAQGKKDHTDQSYFVTPKDITLLKKNFQSQTRVHVIGNDSVAVDHLVKTELKESVIFYQTLSHSKKKPLIIVLSSPWQIQQLKKYGPEMIYLDATYKGITQYGFVLYAVAIKSDHGRGVPVAFFILSEESSQYLSLCLQKLQEAASPFHPRYIMIDRDVKKMEAIRNVFPHAKTLLCWFHVLQAVHRWMLRQEGCNKNPVVRYEVIRSMILLKQCALATDFTEKAKEVTEKLDAMTGTKTISTYLQTQWFQHAEMWAKYGQRLFHQSNKTNNLVESIKYQFPRGYANRRLDELLLLLNKKVFNYCSYMDDLHGADPILDSRTQDTVEAASSMKSAGLLHKIMVKEAGLYSVPSEVEGKYYHVDVVTMQCQCAVSTRGNLCKHILLAKEKCQEMGADIDDLRKEVARSLFEQQSYEWDGEHLIVHHQNDFGVVSAQAKQCTCLANSFQEICVCLRLSERLLQDSLPEECGNQLIESTTVGVSPSETVKDMIAELHEWCQSSDYQETPAILSAVKKAHQLAFGQYTSNVRKRKI
ncbi:uncharacterized protein LOC125891013 [Epinephelus fuscoguttatus]|uniref:uncharacterized protein LOC125891013 n=1 Tax=Epinephelus fuscoguttatus TaxID=293821 RepID=UPI0020D0983C|nr:uncharacterized protein LOC125891013 [Epinephelus fuscoguttatus]